MLSKSGALLAVLACIISWPAGAAAYSVLSHEAIIDSAWDTSIKPLLLKRFPDATAEELREAHGYAYGGAIIQDMGYYPHGSKFFSDLAHYVRSGDFIVILLHDSKDLNEYAFALGAMAHYASDNNGHRLGTNRAVPILYPKLRKKHGDFVTYEDDPLAHVKTEFGFDVLEVAKERYAPESYHDFIGFQVAAPLLEQAFRETYGLDLKSVLTDEEKVIGSYRRDVSKLIPRATRVAWSLKEKEIEGDVPGITRRKFLYNLSRSSYEREWGTDYQRPSFWDRFLAFLYRLLPKIGPLRVLQLKTPTPETERLFQASFNATMDRYRSLLKEEGEARLKLPNDNFDVGEPTGPGQYRLNDDAHAKLLDKLAEQGFADITPDLRAELLGFFADPNAPYATKRKPKEWSRVVAELQQLKSTPPQPVSAHAVPASF
ncbi:MAG TPA: zinc dependent phospholipase C family protein [Candidatus Acidoferrum sp.]|nr:zinc dependent phospholipase C family protein [Candidatus Acidoferrum sp.]